MILHLEKPIHKEVSKIHGQISVLTVLIVPAPLSGPYHFSKHQLKFNSYFLYSSQKHIHIIARSYLSFEVCILGNNYWFLKKNKYSTDNSCTLSREYQITSEKKLPFILWCLWYNAQVHKLINFCIIKNLSNFIWITVLMRISCNNYYVSFHNMSNRSTLLY